MASSERSFDFDAATSTAAAMTMSQQEGTAISVPQWVIDLHDFRQRLFLRTIEPIIEFLLGPAIQNHDPPTTTTAAAITVDDQHRRLSFLPSYVEDVSYLRANSMTFATLTMMLVIMFVISLVFLICF
jgi:hypothetical protein